ncbi:unnamed protein product [Caenorhabditis auriculariae]|uniref:Uncharacterized protein n=1 Tax=Caenorhabditis auriculariae TaxID=2777116 RepID=A0A8S1GY71_9PELO|nr:unnamed protein product [Caenorhabditis auriculariae]
MSKEVGDQYCGLDNLGAPPPPPPAAANPLPPPPAAALPASLGTPPPPPPPAFPPGVIRGALRENDDTDLNSEVKTKKLSILDAKPPGAKKSGSAERDAEEKARTVTIVRCVTYAMHGITVILFVLWLVILLTGLKIVGIAESLLN